MVSSTNEIDLSDPDLNETKKMLQDGRIDWAQFRYKGKKKNCLVKFKSGEAGGNPLEILPKLLVGKEGKCYYFYVRLKDSGTIKFILVYWTGKQIATLRKTRSGLFRKYVSQFFQPIDLEYEAHVLEDLEPSKILEQLYNPKLRKTRFRRSISFTGMVKGSRFLFHSQEIPEKQPIDNSPSLLLSVPQTDPPQETEELKEEEQVETQFLALEETLSQKDQQIEQLKSELQQKQREIESLKGQLHRERKSVMHLQETLLDALDEPKDLLDTEEFQQKMQQLLQIRDNEVQLLEQFKQNLRSQ